MLINQGNFNHENNGLLHSTALCPILLMLSTRVDSGKHHFKVISLTWPWFESYRFDPMTCHTSNDAIWTKKAPAYQKCLGWISIHAGADVNIAYLGSAASAGTSVRQWLGPHTPDPQTSAQGSHTCGGAI